MRRRGYVLLELAVALVIAVLVLVAAAALLQRHARSVRVLYEEQVAQEAASTRMELLEADRGEGLEEGRTEVAVDVPGWENLADPKCIRTVVPEDGGVRRVRFEVTWRAFDGRPRRIELRTRFGGAP